MNTEKPTKQMNGVEPKKVKTIPYSEAKHKRAVRDRVRLLILKDLISKANKITSLIRK